MEDNKYYVYLHIRLDSGEPFYVGKGKGDRFKSKNGRNEYWKNIVNKHGYDIIFLEENLTEDESFEKEIYWIDRIGRIDLSKGTLVNMTDGGEGGGNMSEETKRKISDKRKGRIVSEETRKKLSELHKGKVISDETKKKISDGSIGKVLSEEHKNKISDSNKGRKFSDESKRKISESNKGKVMSEESRNKISQSKKGKTSNRKGKKLSDETKKKMSESRKLYLLNKNIEN